MRYERFECKFHDFINDNQRHVAFGIEEIPDSKKGLHEQKRQLYSHGMQINLSKEHRGNSYERILYTFVGARGYLGRKYKMCTGIRSKRLIRWQRHLARFMFHFAVCFLNEKFMKSTHVNLVFCAVCLTFCYCCFYA